MSPLNRRRFLQTLGAGIGAAWSGAPGWSWAWPTDDFGPERFDLGHLLVRDAQPIEIPPPERHCEVVVAGAGLAGLTAAYGLRDRDLLLLDKEAQTGGHARSAEWEGIRYSLGGAYLTEPYPPLEGFYRKAGLLEGLKRIAEPADALAADGRIAPLFDSADFLRLKKALQRMAARAGAPTIPVEKSASWALAYDRLSLDAFLREGGYGPQVLEYVALYCRSAFSAPPSAVSAFAGLNFLFGEVAPRYSYPGGTAGAAERLTSQIDAAGAGRIRTGCTVAAVLPSVSRARGRPGVVFVDDQGDTHTVISDVVVVALNKMAAARIVREMPRAQVDAIAQAHRGAALVANVCLRKAPPPAAYDTWYSGGVGTDAVAAGWVRDGGLPQPPKPGPQVLTFYCETMRDHASLIGRSAKDWSERILGDLDRIAPGTRADVADVRLSRFGHALICPPPGYITGPRALTRKPMERVLFAHSDGQGLPAFESAIWEGMQAADAARRWLLVERRQRR